MNEVRVVTKSTRKGFENEVNRVLEENSHLTLKDIKFNGDSGSYYALIIFESK